MKTINKLKLLWKMSRKNQDSLKSGGCLNCFRLKFWSPFFQRYTDEEFEKMRQEDFEETVKFLYEYIDRRLEEEREKNTQ